jgi:hypothetical protein
MNAASVAACGPRLLHDWMRDLPTPIHEVIVEKTPANTVRMEWLQTVFPRSYFIGLVRNGYAVVEGMRRKNRKPIEQSAHHWNLINEILIQQAAQVDHYLEIRYEDLTNNLIGTAEQLAKFLELGSDHFSAAMGGQFSFETIVGVAPQRIRNLNAESIASLTADDIETIRAKATPMLDYFGYETPSVLRHGA